MATYLELFELRANQDMIGKIIVACIVAAEQIKTGGDTGALWDSANHANRLKWARAVFADPNTESTRMYYALLAANKAATIATILAASDDAIQAQVNSHVDTFAT